MTSEGKGLPVSPELVEGLAAAGAICERCGGIHGVSIDQLIVALSVQRKTGTALPWCHCPDCSVCQDDPATTSLVRQFARKHGLLTNQEGESTK